MEQYIPKSALMAEIKKRRDAFLMRQQNLESIGQEYVINEMVANELNKIISLINTLEVKEVNLEEEMSKYLGDGWKKDADGKIESEMMAFAKHFFELGLKSQQGIKSED